MDSVKPENGSPLGGTEVTTEVAPPEGGAALASPQEGEEKTAADAPVGGDTAVGTVPPHAVGGTAPHSSQSPRWSDGALASLARGLTLWVLLGFAAVTLVQLGVSKTYTVPLLEKNSISMPARIYFIV